MAVYSVYSIRNKFNGKRYIGLSYKPLKRMESHRGSPFPVGKAIRKYGWNNFDKRILKTGLTLRQAQKAERFYIAKYKSLGRYGYNLCAGGEGLFNPPKHIRDKISKTNRENGTYNFSEKRKERLKIARNKPEVEAKRMATMKKNGNDKRKGKALKNIHKGLKNRPNKKEELRKAIETKIKNGYIRPIEPRICENKNCGNSFECKVDSKRKFCCKACVIRIGQGLGRKRKPFSKETRKKLSESKAGKNNPNWIPREIRSCACGCNETFEIKITSKQKYISKHGYKFCGIHN